MIKTNAWNRAIGRAAAIAAVVLGASAIAGADPVVTSDGAWTFAQQQLLATSKALSPVQYPDFTGSSSGWDVKTENSWTCGFLPGLDYLMFEKTGDASWEALGQSWTAGIAPRQYDTTTHDVGFALMTSYGNDYRLTGNPDDVSVLLNGAQSLSTRFNPVIGCTESRDDTPQGFQVLIDNMMNLELLFWASAHGGSSVYRVMAVSHALVTLQQHIRPDGSTYQAVYFDPNTGAVLLKTTDQGYSATSCWSRGQAWAMYGFTMCYRYTSDPRFLAAAREVSDYYVAHMPADGVAYWDFNDPKIPNAPRDTSAAATAASAMLELSGYVPDLAGQQEYRLAAGTILSSLSGPAYLAQGTKFPSVLIRGTYTYSDKTTNRGLIFGDYYFLEALKRYAQLPDIATKLTPVQDGYVRDKTYHADNFGNLSTLIVKKPGGAENRISYLTFDLSAISTNVKSAVMRLYGNNQSDSGYSGGVTAYAVANTTWNEMTLDWDNRPALGATVASTAITSATQFYSWDLTSYIQAQISAGAKQISIALTMDVPSTNGQGDSFRSKDSTTNKPELDLTLN